MKNLIYIGNKLASHGKNLTSIETLGPALENEGFRVIYASSAKNKLIRLLDMIWTVLRHFRWADYVLIDTYSTQNFWYALIVSQICRVLRVPYIPKLHGGDLPNRIQRTPKLSRMVFDPAFVNVAPSAYLMDAFDRAGYDNLVYIPNTIDVSKYEYTSRSVVRPRLLWVRSFATIYNPEMAVKVAASLQKSFPETELCMVGPDRNGLMSKIAQLAVQENVKLKLTGRISKEEWADLSRDYDVFINTTHFDNTPVSVIEALALGLPVVSTNVGGLPFLLTDHQTALLVDDDDHQGMLEAIEKLLLSPELVSRLGQNGRNLVLEFDFEAVKARWFQILS